MNAKNRHFIMPTDNKAHYTDHLIKGQYHCIEVDVEKKRRDKAILFVFGGGYNIRRMLEMSAKAKFIGMDISDESVKKAEKVNKAEIGKRVKIIKGSAENLPFKDDSIDLITAFETVFF